MNSAQDRLVLAAMTLAESAYLFSALGAIGFTFGQERSPLGWIAVLSILVTSHVVARTLQMILMPIELAYGLQMGVGALVIYLVLGTQAGVTGGGVDLLWIGGLAGAPDLDRFTFTAAVGSLAGVALWWRGGRIAATQIPGDDLLRSFKIGLLVMTVAAIVETSNEADLNTYPMMFVFFAAALSGLVLGRLFPASARALSERTWHRVVLAVGLSVVAVGLFLSLVQNAVLPAVSRMFLAAGGFFAFWVLRLVFLAIIYPVAYAAGLLLDLILMILPEPNLEQESEAPPSEGIMEFIREVQEQAEAGTGSRLLDVIEWTLVAIVIAIALFFLARAFRRRFRYVKRATEGIRESVRDDADLAQDWMRLALGLLPRRLRKKGGVARMRLPDGPHGIVDVFRVYYGMLEQAQNRGVKRSPSETPVEFGIRLERIFPRALVRRTTEAFNRACYGHVASPQAEIDEMRRMLEGLEELKGAAQA